MDAAYGLALRCRRCGELAVAEEGGYFNRMYFVRPDGCMEYYDKRHLFAMDGEADHYTAGRRRVVVEWRGVRILLQGCYDLRFPVFSRNRGDYDIIIYSPTGLHRVLPCGILCCAPVPSGTSVMLRVSTA